MVGIYIITNLINKNVYVGQTTNFKRRKIDHFYELKRNIHFNKYLQNSYNKYGENNFKMELIEECPISILNDRETFWYNHYCDLLGKRKVYNLQHTGDSHNCSQETKDKISKSVKGKNHPLYGKPCSEERKRKISIANGRKVICVETGVIYNSVAEAAKLTNATHHIAECCSNGRMSGNFHWRYLSDINKKWIPHTRRILCIETNKIYNRFVDAAKSVNGDSYCISKCCRGTRLTAYGYHWRFYDAART